jgi:hypothetical protein
MKIASVAEVKSQFSAFLTELKCLLQIEHIMRLAKSRARQQPGCG